MTDRDSYDDLLGRQTAEFDEWHNTADRLARRVAELEQTCEKAIRERRSLESKEDDWHRAYERSERRVAELEADRFAVLVAFYAIDAPLVARICDEKLDKGSALLGHVRDKFAELAGDGGGA